MADWRTSTTFACISTRNGAAEMTFQTISLKGPHYRLIPSRFPPIDVYERLGAPVLGAAAKRLEALTNPRLAALGRQEATPNGDGASRSPRYQNWNHAPFAYKGPEGSWLLPPAYGALELALDEPSALLLALVRREAFLARTGEPAIALDMRMLVTEVDGEFADLRCEPPASREERWALGEQLRKGGVVGALHARVEVPGGVFLSVFDGGVLGGSTQAAHYRFSWNGERIRDVYDFAGHTIEPRQLMREVAERRAA